MSLEKYTLMEIASNIGLSKSTVYQWFKFFQPFFQPFQTKAGKGTCLNREGLELFQQIKTWKENGNTTLDDINKMLTNKEYKDSYDEPGTSGINLESSEVERLIEENKWLKDQLEKANGELAETRKRQDTIIMQLTRNLGDTQKALEMKNMSWWKRLRQNKGKDVEKH